MSGVRVRWQCPNGHPGVLGPGRPPKDSVVRYCLKCSADTGRLVERVAPALERKRAQASVSQAAKAKAKRASAARVRANKKAAENARYMVEGVDLRVELKRMIRLTAFGGKKSRLFRRPPTLQISRRSQHPLSRLGCASPWENKIIIAVWPSRTLEGARETLLHELTHIVVGKVDGQWHGSKFRVTLAKARRQYNGYKIVQTTEAQARQAREEKRAA